MKNPKPYLIAFYKDLEKGYHVSAVADRLLFEGSEDYGGTIVLLSVVGPHSAVRGLLAAVATGREVRADRYPRNRFHGREGGRLLTAALGNGVIHGCYVGPQLLKSDENRFAILGQESRKVFDRLSQSMAIPALPEWADWIVETLRSKELLMHLKGMGAEGCTLNVSEEEIDAILTDGVKKGVIKF